MKIEELKNIPELPGIYLFTNKVNNKHYVGQAINLKNRLKEHIYCIRHPENIVTYFIQILINMDLKILLLK